MCVAVACSPKRESDLLRAELSNGSAVASLLRADSATALIAIAPRHCFSCDKSLAELVRLKPASPTRVLTILSRTPTPGERLMFQLNHVALAGILKRELSDTVTLQVVRDGRTISLYHNPSAAQVREFTIALLELR
jgi:hypothetical protein